MFNYDSVLINPEVESSKIIECLRNSVKNVLRKRGAVIGISGGIDSSVVLALAVKAFGSNKVIGIMMPEKDSSPDSLYLAQKLVDQYGISSVVEDVGSVLQGFDCYGRRDEAIKSIFSEYNENYKMKITLPKNNDDDDKLNVFYASIIAPDGKIKSERLPIKEYLQVVAASNFKQRSRMTMLYYHAEINNYAVIGTGNKNEHEQGFFVKYGDGGADIKPIAHLFKTQVYQLAEYLDVPEEIRRRTPTTDTYSAEQTQEEFFYQVPFEIMDRVWFAMENDVPNYIVANVLGITERNVEIIQNNIKQKIKGTEYLRLEPLEIHEKINQK